MTINSTDVEHLVARPDNFESASDFRPVKGQALPKDPSRSPIVLFTVLDSWLDAQGKPLDPYQNGIVATTEARLQLLISQLAASNGPLSGADFAGHIGWYWREAEQGALGRPTDISAAYVLSSLRGSRINHAGKRRAILYGDGLPYAIGPVRGPDYGTQGGPKEAQEFRHADVLPVVLCWNWTGSDKTPVEGRQFGPFPYFLALGDLPQPAPGTSTGDEGLLPSVAANALAKALCKVLGLGDEGTEFGQLSAPDFWGRAFPNLWCTNSPSAASCPWHDIVTQHHSYTAGDDIYVVGGFGMPHTVYRPTNDCLMSKKLGEGGALCPVCTHHLAGVLPRSLPDTSADPESAADPGSTRRPLYAERVIVEQGGVRSVLGIGVPPAPAGLTIPTISVNTWGSESVELFKSLGVQATATGAQGDPEIVPTSLELIESDPEQWLEDPDLYPPFQYRWTWASGMTVSVFIHGILNAAGRSIVVRTVLDRKGGSTTDDTSVVKLKLERSGTLLDSPAMYASPRNLETFLDRVTRGPGRLPIDQVVEVVMRGGGWNIKMNAQETDDGAFLLTGKHPDPSTTGAERLHPPFHSPAGLVLSGRGRQVMEIARMWPLPLQGEGTPALLELIGRSLPRPTDGDRAGAGSHELLAYVQCVGVTDRWPFSLEDLAPNEGVTYDANTEIVTLPTLAATTEDYWSGSFSWLWSSPGVPATLDRLGRLIRRLADLPDVHPGVGTTPATPPAGPPKSRAVLDPIFRAWDDQYRSEDDPDEDTSITSNALSDDANRFRELLRSYQTWIQTTPGPDNYYSGVDVPLLNSQDYQSLRSIIWRWAISAPDDSGIKSFLDTYKTLSSLGEDAQDFQDDVIREDLPFEEGFGLRIRLIMHPTYPAFLGEIRGMLVRLIGSSFPGFRGLGGELPREPKRIEQFLCDNIGNATDACVGPAPLVANL